MNPMTAGFMTALGKRRELLVLLGLGASTVYLLLGQHQSPTYLAVASIFLAFAAFQLLLAITTLFAPGHRLFAIGFVGNLMLLIVGIGSHLLGLPFSAHPTSPQVLGSAELSLYLMEILQVILYFRLARSTKREKQSGILRIVLVSVLSLLLVYGLTSLGITSVFA